MWDLCLNQVLTRHIMYLKFLGRPSINRRSVLEGTGDYYMGTNGG